MPRGYANATSDLLRLPPELLFQIYLRLGCLEAVWALMCTSRRLWTAFHLQPAKVVRHVLASTTPHRVLSVIHADWNIRAGHLRHMTLEELRCIDESMTFNALYVHVSPCFVRRFLALARAIHGTAHIILNDCLQNLGSIQDRLCPFPMLFPEIAGRQRVDPKPFLGPPTWGEEMRMIQGLWLCDFHSLLTKAARDQDPPWLGRVLANIQRDGMASLEDFYFDGWPGTFWTIFRGLSVMASPPAERRTPYGQVTVIPDTMSLAMAPLRVGGLDLALRCRSGAFGWQRAGAERELNRSFVRQLEPLAEGYDFVSEDETARAPLASDVYRLPVCEYAQFGLLHWSSRRMRGLGLIHKNDGRIADIWHGRVYDYWLSILPVELVGRWASIQKNGKTEQEAVGEEEVRIDETGDWENER